MWSDTLAKTLTAANRSSSTALRGVDDKVSTKELDVCRSRNSSSVMVGSIDGNSGEGKGSMH